MANKKITELSGAVTLANADLLPIVQDVSTTPVTKKVTLTTVKDFLETYFDTLYAPIGGGGAVDSVNGQTGVVVLDADDIDDTSTTNKFITASELSKLSGIEALADVTDATNVAAAGAIMDSDFASNGLMQRTGVGTYAVVTAPSGTIVGHTDTITLTNKTIDGNNNTLTVLAASQLSGQVPLANGGTGANLSDPNADRIVFWDDSLGAMTWLSLGSRQYRL
jgi:hypothetical protein